MGVVRRWRNADPTQPLAAVLFYRFCRALVVVLLTLVYRLRVDHAERVPMRGPSGAVRGLLVVSNHQSHLDPPIVGAAMGRRNMAAIARAGLFRLRPLAWVMHGLGTISIKEGEPDAAAMKAAIEALRLGRAVLIFPEGSRSPDGRLQEFKRGCWLLIRRSGCDVLPMGIRGAFEAWPRSRSIPRIFGQRCRCAVGRLIPHERLASLDAEAGLRLLTSDVQCLLDELKAKA